jgi:hypothetical protein
MKMVCVKDIYPNFCLKGSMCLKYIILLVSFVDTLHYRHSVSLPMRQNPEDRQPKISWGCS